MPFEYRKSLKVRPPNFRGFAVPESLISSRHEIALIIQLVCERRLFGLAYLELQPDYFDAMPQDSGVLLCPLVLTRELFPEAVRPGDIDLLVIPYENDQLVLHRVMAIEAKAIRATFMKQGKAPNEFGFSQAAALLDLGFPYVALAHLIVSDTSPESAWREMGVAEKIDDDGRVKILPNIMTDMMPADLMNRGLGRLRANRRIPELGLLAAYLETAPRAGFGNSFWFPEGMAARFNPKVTTDTLERIGDFYHANVGRFIMTPRFPPSETKPQSGAKR